MSQCHRLVRENQCSSFFKDRSLWEKVGSFYSFACSVLRINFLRQETEFTYATSNQQHQGTRILLPKCRLSAVENTPSLSRYRVTSGSFNPPRQKMKTTPRFLSRYVSEKATTFLPKTLLAHYWIYKPYQSPYCCHTGKKEKLSYQLGIPIVI